MPMNSSGPKQRSTQIEVRGARVHNLKNVSVDIPHRKLTVITGLSGSGKSSLAFSTLYAEGQRRFVESLSAYARQFLDRMGKPDVDAIHGLPPAVAIEQQGYARNPRSTVGTTTEIYDYLRLLYGRIGVVIDKDSGEIVRKDTPESVTEAIIQEPEGSRLYILAQLPPNHASIEELRDGLLAGGYTRLVFADGVKIVDVADLTELPDADVPVYVVVDRLVIEHSAELRTRLMDSLETAFELGEGRVLIRYVMTDGSTLDKAYSSRFESNTTQTQYIEPEPRLFSFNNPFGACPVCQGFGRSVGIDENLVFPDTSLSIKRGAIHPFRGDSFGSHLRALLREAPAAKIPVDKPLYTLSPQELHLVMEGVGQYIGVNGFFKMLEEKSYKTHYRVMLSRYRGYTRCKACGGSRLRTAARQVFVGGMNIPDVVQLSLSDARDHFQNLMLSDHALQIVGPVLDELRRRLGLLCDIGLEYLTLDRLTHTLSGGESQRINLATSLGSALVGTLYVLDEPSIGLHPRDTGRLLSILSRLRNLGNTVVVVEHDPEVVQAADNVIDIGPGAGEHGGQVVFQGTVQEMLADPTTLTSQYLAGVRTVRADKPVRKGNGKMITVRKPLHHNLKGDDISIPVGKLTVVTGVSGSGKSSFVHDVLFGGLRRVFGGAVGEAGHCESIEGLAAISGVEMIDQSPIGRSSRSTPVTYTKAFDAIRDVFASTQAAKQMGWKAGHFSFNVSGGRCDVCEGEGSVTVEMQFLPDITLPCEACNGTRYKREVSRVLYNNKSIIDVLEMTVTEALEHFADVPKVFNKLSILKNVGLGYIRLGQPSSQLSGGEAQRVKLATYLDTQSDGNTLFIFDEPTTGLHVHDVSVLLQALDSLVDAGNTVVIVEHNLHVIAAADYVVDLGPEGGKGGGHLVVSGTPKQVAKCATSYTGKALKAFYAGSPTHSSVSV